MKVELAVMVVVAIVVVVVVVAVVVIVCLCFEDAPVIPVATEDGAAKLLTILPDEQSSRPILSASESNTLTEVLPNVAPPPVEKIRPKLRTSLRLKLYPDTESNNPVTGSQITQSENGELGLDDLDSDEDLDLTTLNSDGDDSTSTPTVPATTEAGATELLTDLPAGPPSESVQPGDADTIEGKSQAQKLYQLVSLEGRITAFADTIEDEARAQRLRQIASDIEQIVVGEAEWSTLMDLMATLVSDYPEFPLNPTSTE